MRTSRGSFSDRRRSAGPLTLLLVVSILSAAGCGKKGPPLPPAPRGPLPPQSVSARQLGALVEVRLDVPPARGTRPSQQAVRAELIRVTYPRGSAPAADPDAFRRRGVEVTSLQREALMQGERLLLVDRSLPVPSADDDGWTARYAVRLRDRRNRPSSLVVAPDLGILPSVPPPAGLEATPTADGVRLAWEVGQADVTRRFNLYRSDPHTGASETPLNAQPLEVGEYLDASVELGRTYRYFLRTALASGRPYRESPSGESVIVLAADWFPPAPPDGLVAVPEAGTVRLFWNPGTDRDLAGYRVYRKRTGEDWVRVGDSIIEQATFVDADVNPGALLVYRVTALDRVEPPNESAPSTPFELQLPGGEGP